ncbi:MAG: RsmE family RNA methyltransferase [Caldithrix sp.]|nr:RsmE family RNA methyltransferase [Caldithrix sp.]
MELFFAARENIEPHAVTFDRFESQHILKSLRKKTGQSIIVTDGEGRKIYGSIIQTKPIVVAEIDSVETMPRPKPAVALAVGFIRPNRLELLLEKGTEIGIQAFYLLGTEYANYISKNEHRFTKVIRQAIKQSVQFFLPKIAIFDNFNKFLVQVQNYRHKIVATSANDPALHDRLSVLNDSLREDVCLLIGPEGGLSSDEIGLAQANGFISVSLSENRLRTETAAISAAAITQLFLHHKKES